MVIIKWPEVLNLAKYGNPAPDHRVVKTDAEWRHLLSEEQYHVTRQAGTERAFSSEMCSLFEPGIYSCLCCETVLFGATEKFESGTGWPSFTQPIKDNVIAYRFDGPSFLKRVETVCNTCDAHLVSNTNPAEEDGCESVKRRRNRMCKSPGNGLESCTGEKSSLVVVGYAASERCGT